jgi:hypothetical protein
MNRTVPTTAGRTWPRHEPPKPFVRITFDWRAAWQHHRELFWSMMFTMTIGPFVETFYYRRHAPADLLWLVPLSVGGTAVWLLGWWGVGYGVRYYRLRLWPPGAGPAPQLLGLRRPS